MILPPHGSPRPPGLRSRPGACCSEQWHTVCLSPAQVGAVSAWDAEAAVRGPRCLKPPWRSCREHRNFAGNTAGNKCCGCWGRMSLSVLCAWFLTICVSASMRGLRNTLAHFSFFLIVYFLLYFSHCHLSLLYPLLPPTPAPNTHNHHTVVCVHESFFFLAPSLHPQPTHPPGP